eukprot:CAMPEP_0173220236 /NCGR_PEP_ID=MMETSP1142-20121109/2047_1 /TAXON_ID=483371 /ORGANISM="non described non described, Strain CCMP2298" /LENGTH=106 /DNA_ID=CAMNT_0014148121 /DNA_START=597 /DNA_END=917 /DNA_ORIENTATION=+
MATCRNSPQAALLRAEIFSASAHLSVSRLLLRLWACLRRACSPPLAEYLPEDRSTRPLQIRAHTPHAGLLPDTQCGRGAVSIAEELAPQPVMHRLSAQALSEGAPG